MTDNPELSIKAKGVAVIKKIVYGNTAKSFGKKREEDGHTHQWTVYLKPFVNEDMSLYIKKVHFKLHESYANPNRIISSPPYEVTETGWGEFEIVIKIWFNDPNERPVTVYHILKLFASQGEIGKKEVTSECYDELVFQEPSVALHRMLTEAKQRPGEYTHPTDCECPCIDLH
ncbi:hypothetical protein QYM36_013381 [Artemia franciscana]|uniref:YEATS domain-containing protein n=1 Tax=Artemia franciscana TaxID=6661 RepID=A0AA88HG46_ARTSF|nr:hypothetical protein QYM36_013381 [Artemia franciscana]